MARLDSHHKDSSLLHKSSAHKQNILAIGRELASSASTSSLVQRAQRAPATLRPADVLMLQRALGNQAVQRLLYPSSDSHREATKASAPSHPVSSAQGKLKVGPANDLYEQEADRVARQVVNAPQRLSSEESPQPQAKAQRKAEGALGSGSAFEQRLAQTKSGGKALPDKTRAEFEPRLGADLSNVRLHTDAQSHALNRTIQAKAFTHGNDIHFGPGQYDPHSSEGKHLLAHEVTHTIQQSGGQKGITPAAVATIQRKINFTSSDLYPSRKKVQTLSSSNIGKSDGEQLLSKLEEALDNYHSDISMYDELKWLQFIKTKAMQWVRDTFQEQNGDILKNVLRLIKACDPELVRLEDVFSREEYLGHVDSPSQTKSKYLTNEGKKIADMAKKWHEGTDTSDRGKDATELIRERKLDRAETTGIGIYTAKDYKYMNPALAKSEPWMRKQLIDMTKETDGGFHFDLTKSQIEDRVGRNDLDKNLKEATEAGNRHAKFALQGLNKLEVWKGQTFRGAAEAPGDVATKYKVNAYLDFPTFVSSSTMKSTGETFAKQNLDNEKTTPVLIVLAVTNGRDIAKLALYHTENEILLLPGCKFRITSVTPGIVAFLHGYIVHATQTA